MELKKDMNNYIVIEYDLRYDDMNAWCNKFFYGTIPIKRYKSYKTRKDWYPFIYSRYCICTIQSIVEF